MEIVLIGLNHRTAPVRLREKISFPANALAEPLKRMVAFPEISEGFILSTCNRVEVLATGSESKRIIHRVEEFLEEYHRIPLDEFRDHLYIHTSMEAVRHLFRVASSLDSMVIGEPQILGQIKDAYREATESNSCGAILNKLLHHAFRVAKRVRTETEIACSAVSVSYAAVELAKRIFESLREKIVLLIGAGAMAELALRHFIGQGVKGIRITNRTFERAEALAKAFHGTAIPFETFRRHLTEADVVLSSTGAPEPILDREDIARCMKLRKSRPMFLIDIAVPRDIDPSVNGIPNVYLYNIDDLQGIVQNHIDQRKGEAFKAEQLIDQEVENFQRWIQTMEVTPTIKDLRRRMEEIRRTELEKAKVILKGLDERDERVLDAMTKAILNKVLHDPISLLKKEAHANGDRYYTAAIRKLFKLDEKDP